MLRTPETLLVIGFDGLDYQIFRRRCSADLQVMPLYSPVPVTGPAWTSLYTGDSVGTHGVKNGWGFELPFLLRDDVRQRAQQQCPEVTDQLKWLRSRISPARTCATTDSTYLWQTLSAAGVNVKLVNMPITCPVHPVTGVHLGGFPVLRSSRYYYPDIVACRIPDDYLAMSDIVQWFQEPESSDYAQWRPSLEEMGLYVALARVRRLSMRMCELFGSFPRAQLEMIQFSFVDRIGHVFGMQAEAEDLCYEIVQDLIANMVEVSQPAATMIVSDHGFRGPQHTDYGVLAVGGQLRDALQVPQQYQPDVLDVAPTLAGYLGLTHPCEGNDLTRLQITGARDKGFARSERTDVLRRMRDLGYM